MAQALTVQAPSLRPTVSSTYHAVPVRFRVTLVCGLQVCGLPLNLSLLHNEF